ncbi:MAG: hypothetical protein JSV09_02185 [Thermoplasmata archaeon]|nr:MAG: hypothetical protein JSV09_02185 [Thermoplasmata archaeon]
MKITRWHIFFLLLVSVGIVIILNTAFAWTPTPVQEDRNLFMPGTQPGNAGSFQSANKCDNCHGGYNPGVEPAYTWRGSMMAQAARDPLWLACLTVADQDSIHVLGNPNVGDLCIRCHSPTGWLEGRSEPTNTAGLQGKDFEGVQCDFCHRMIDPFTELDQPDVPVVNDPTAITMAQETYQRDLQILNTHTLFDGTPFLDANTNLPTYYGDGNFDNYIEHASGQFFVDPSSNIKRGPFWDAEARHGVLYSRHHQSMKFCSACHDVSNPVLASVFLGADVPETQAAATYYHVERTTSEFLLSAYGNGEGGAPTNIPGVDTANKCQDCHMRDVSGMGCNKKGTPTRDDLPLHDLTGGNAWISGILATADQTGPVYDPYNYQILSGQKYEGAQIDITGLQGYGQELVDGSNRAIQQLEMAATLSIENEDASSVTIRVKNNGGHKLISGFPEGRRMFLNVKFFDSNGVPILNSEINPYDPLITTQDADGNEVYVSGGTITAKTEELVWECEMSSLDITGEQKSFHFALGSDRYKDNRIPPKGFDPSKMYDRLAQPRWEGANATDYFTAAEYAGGYDEVTISKPAGTVTWYATLYYQTTSKEYIEFLKWEINGDPAHRTLPDSAYIAQTDPFFANLKGWGDAIWDLWLHNGGSAPVMMTQVGDIPAPPCTIDTPTGLTAQFSKKGGGSIELNWNPVGNAEGYNVYYSQNGKYTFIASTSTTKYLDRNVIKGQTYTYVVTAYKTCPDETVIESGYSNEASATAN